MNSAVFESDSCLVESDPIAIPGVFRNEAPYKGKYESPFISYPDNKINYIFNL